MLVAEIVVVIGNHLVRLTLEAHTLVASTACHSIATVNPDHWDLTSLVRTLPDAVFQHVFLEELVAACLCLFTG